MQPWIGTLSATTFGWLLAAVLAGGAIIGSTYREGLTLKQIVFLLLGCTAALLIGAKVLYLVEVPRWSAGAIFSQQVRLPGGMLAVLLISPWLPRLAGAPPWRTADLIAPGLALLILGTRIGCFLEGCCYGEPSSLPWALPFPLGSEAHAWQVQQGLIPISASYSLPVQPLQLYFAIVGALLFLLLAEYQPHKRYEGEIALLFALAYLWSTWLLEFLRAQPHVVAQQFTLVASVAATALALYVALSGSSKRHARPRA